MGNAHHRASTTIEHQDWKEVIKRYDRPHTLFYCDPPYWQTEGYGVAFGWEEYERLASNTKSIEGKMIISINDHPDIRRVFAHIPCKEVNYLYNIGGGANISKGVELIYGNWANGVTEPSGFQLGFLGMD